MQKRVNYHHDYHLGNSRVRASVTSQLNKAYSPTLQGEAEAATDEKKLSWSLQAYNVQSVRHGIEQINSARCLEETEAFWRSSESMARFRI